jgi:hypothetical protein
MRFNSLMKNETRLTTTDELIAAAVKGEHSGIRLYISHPEKGKTLYAHGSCFFIISKYKNHITLKVNGFDKIFLTITDGIAIMDSIGAEKVEIQTSTVDSLEFFQYECLGVDFCGISSDSMKTLIKFLEGELNAVNK